LTWMLLLDGVIIYDYIKSLSGVMTFRCHLNIDVSPQKVIK
jgi:hypothetical protein